MGTVAGSKWSGAFNSGAWQDMTAIYNASHEENLVKKGQAADAVTRELYLASLRSPAPVQWVSDHLREDQRYMGAVYVAIKVMADQASQATKHIFKWKDDAKAGASQDEKEPLLRKHPLCKLLDRPNAQDSWGILMRRITQQLCLTGTSLLWRVDNGFDMPRELWSIPTGTYQPVAISDKYPNGGYHVYPWFPGPLALVPGYLPVGGITVPAEHMVRTLMPHPYVQQEGQSPLNACSLALDTIQSIDRARFNTMRRGINPSATVELDPTVVWPDEQQLMRITQQIKQVVGGPDRSGGVAVLGPGQKLVPWTPGNIEVGWIDSWNQLIDFVLSVFGITKSLAFMSEEQSYATLYAALKQYNLFTLCPFLELISDNLNHQLVKPFYGDDVFLELHPKKIDDKQEVEAEITNDLKCGARLVNEIRVIRGLEPIKELDGERAWATGKEEEVAGEEQGKVPDHQAPGLKKEDEQQTKNRPENTNGHGSIINRLILNGRH